MRHIRSAAIFAILGCGVSFWFSDRALALDELCPGLVVATLSGDSSDTTITPSNLPTAIYSTTPQSTVAQPPLPADFPRFGSAIQRAVLASRYSITNLEGCFACGFEAHLYRYLSERGESRVLKLARSGKQEERDALAEEVRLAQAARAAGATGAAPLIYDPDVNGVHRPHYPSTLLELLPTLRVTDLPSARRAIALIRSLAQNLQAMHRAQITFRDLTPKNIFIDFSGRPVLTDFGIAAQAGAGHANWPKGIPFGSATGTFSHMSPGQQAAQAPVAAHDLFALGVVAWEIMVGHSISQPQTPRECRTFTRTFKDQTTSFFRIAASPASAISDFPTRLEPLSAAVMIPATTTEQFLENFQLAENAIAEGDPSAFFYALPVQRQLGALLNSDPAIFEDAPELWRRLSPLGREQVIRYCGWPEGLR